jgi:hypothetical protein
MSLSARLLRVLVPLVLYPVQQVCMLKKGGNDEPETKKPQDVIQGTRCVYPLTGAYTLKSFFADDPEEEPVTFVKMKPGVRERARTRTRVQAKPSRKSSYESGVDVQRWLQEQAYEEQPSSPAFNPTLLASRRDAPWILSSLTPFYNQHLITDVLHESHSHMYLLISQATNTLYQIFTPVLFVPLYASHFTVDDTLATFTPITHASYSKVVISSHGLWLKMLDCERSANQCGNNLRYRWCPFDDQSHLTYYLPGSVSESSRGSRNS